MLVHTHHDQIENKIEFTKWLGLAQKRTGVLYHGIRYCDSNRYGNIQNQVTRIQELHGSNKNIYHWNMQTFRQHFSSISGIISTLTFLIISFQSPSLIARLISITKITAFSQFQWPRLTLHYKNVTTNPSDADREDQTPPALITSNRCNNL